MNWAWAAPFDQLWRSPNFPMWLAMAAAGFFALVVLITLLRAEKSVANGALAVITLLAIGVAVAATFRGYGSSAGRSASGETQSPQTVAAMPPALSCIDDLAGEAVLTACEKALFSSPESVAAAVSYAAGRITQLTGYGDVAAANAAMTPDLQALRRSVERDRYGLMAYVLTVRDRCQPEQCAAFQALTDHNQIAANMAEKIYEDTVTRRASSWNAPAPVGTIAALPQAVQTGRPTTAEFPSSASIPPINIMTPEPAAAPPRSPPPIASTQPPSAASSPPPQPRPAATAAKKQAAPKQRAATPSAPVQLSPAPGAPSAAAPKPSAANE